MSESEGEENPESPDGPPDRRPAQTDESARKHSPT